MNKLINEFIISLYFLFSGSKIKLVTNLIRLEWIFLLLKLFSKFLMNGAILSVIFELENETEDNILIDNSEICDCSDTKA